MKKYALEESPVVCIGICTWNDERFISDAIKSALAQDYPNIKIMILDDASTDSTPEIIRSFQQKYPDTIEAIISAENHGIGWGRGFLKQRANTPFFAFLDGDDLYHPKRISTLMSVMLSRDVDVVIDMVREVYEDGSPAERIIFPDLNCRKDPHFTRILENMTVLASPLMNLQSMGDIDFDPDLRNSEDWDFWCRATLAGKRFAFVEEELAYYRRNPISITSMRRGIIPWHRKVLEKIPLNLVESVYRERNYSKEQIASVMGRQCLRRGKYEEALNWLEQNWCEDEAQDQKYFYGVALIYTGQSETAAKCWQEYVQSYTDDPGGFNNLAVAILGQDLIRLSGTIESNSIKRVIKQSIDCLQHALKIFPQYQDAGHNLSFLQNSLDTNEVNPFFNNASAESINTAGQVTESKLLVSETRILSRR